MGTLERSVKAGGAGQIGAWWGAGWEKDRESGGTEEGLGAGLGRGRGRPRLKAAGRAGESAEPAREPAIGNRSPAPELGAPGRLSLWCHRHCQPFLALTPHPGAPRVLEFWSTRAETSRQRFLGAPGSGKTVPGTPPFFPRERTPCIALSSSSCSSVLWSFFLSVPLSLSQTRLPSHQIFVVLPLRCWTPRFCLLPCLSVHQSLPWVSTPICVSLHP